MEELRNNWRTHLMQQKRLQLRKILEIKVQKAYDTRNTKNKLVHQYNWIGLVWCLIDDSLTMTSDVISYAGSLYGPVPA
eukprot:642370-Pelagomonas_calceolata.AAC.1